MTWILIVYFWGSGAGMTQIPGFKTEAACHESGKQWVEAPRRWGVSPHHACIRAPD